MRESMEPMVLNRRHWWRGVARSAALSGLGLGTFWLVARNGVGQATACRHDLACGRCPIVHRCTLPERVPADGKEHSHD